MGTANKSYAYVRISSNHQCPQRQVQALIDYGIEERDIIIDKQSGKDFNREGYLTLKNSLLRSGDTLVVKELDRLGRNKTMIKQELEYFKENNIRLKVLNIPTTLIEVESQSWVLDMVSNILIEVISSVAEEERIMNHTRQAEGIESARKRGVRFGRPKVVIPDNYYEVMEKVSAGKMTAVDAMKTLGLKRTSYYNLKKEYIKSVSN